MAAFETEVMQQELRRVAQLENNYELVVNELQYLRSMVDNGGILPLFSGILSLVRTA